MRSLLAFASAITILVAAWLFYVTAAVLPTRDPGHVTLWRSVADEIDAAAQR